MTGKIKGTALVRSAWYRRGDRRRWRIQGDDPRHFGYASLRNSNAGGCVRCRNLLGSKARKPNRFAGLVGFGNPPTFFRQYFNADFGRPLPLEAEKLSRATGQINNPTVGEWPPVIDPHNQGAPVFQIRHPHKAWHGQRPMRRSYCVLVKDFTIGSIFIMKIRSVPGCNPRFDISIIDFRIIPDTVDLVGRADLVSSGRLALGQDVPNLFGRMNHQLRFGAGG